jgi:hypothetical protein
MSQRRYPCSKRLAKVRPWGGSKVTVVAKDKQKSMVKHTYIRDMIQQNGRDELHREPIGTCLIIFRLYVV